MNSLSSGRVARTLDKLHQDAEASDQEHLKAMMAAIEARGTTAEEAIADMIAGEGADYRATYHRYADNFLAVSPAYGRFLYAMARACKAIRIVEFGTSMGIRPFISPQRCGIMAAGISSAPRSSPPRSSGRAPISTRQALSIWWTSAKATPSKTLADVGAAVDLLLIDGAFSLYLPVLKLIEPRLKSGAMILGENAFAPDYLDYVRNPANGYLSQPLPVDEGRGNEFTVRTS